MWPASCFTVISLVGYCSFLLEILPLSIGLFEYLLKCTSQEERNWKLFIMVSFMSQNPGVSSLMLRLFMVAVYRNVGRMHLWEKWMSYLDNNQKKPISYWIEKAQQQSEQPSAPLIPPLPCWVELQTDDLHLWLEDFSRANNRGHTLPLNGDSADSSIWSVGSRMFFFLWTDLN